MVIGKRLYTNKLRFNIYFINITITFNFFSILSEYLKHAECLRKAHHEFGYCGQRHQSELDALNRMHEHNKHHSEGGSMDTAVTSQSADQQITRNLLQLCE